MTTTVLVFVVDNEQLIQYQLDDALTQGTFAVTMRTDKDVKNALRANVRRRLHQPKARRDVPAS